MRANRKSRYQDLKRQCETKLRNPQQLVTAKSERTAMACKLQKPYGQARTSTRTLLASYSTIIPADQFRILERWSEHFSAQLNQKSPAAEDFLTNVLSRPLKPWMSQPPSLVEFDRAIKRIPQGKSPGPDNIPYKRSQRGGLTLKSRLFSLILRMWESEKFQKILKTSLLSASSKTELFGN